MAELLAPELTEANGKHGSSADDMELEISDAAANMGTSVDSEPKSAANGESTAKRATEECSEAGEEKVEVSKKQKVEKLVGEERIEKVGEGDEKASGPVNLGPKTFVSSVEMFDYFYKFLHFWTPNLNVNKYEHMILLELLKKGHCEHEKKTGRGVFAFQVRIHPQWKTRCFFLVREDSSIDDFSFRKCVDHILPLPEDMKVKQEANKALLGGKGKGVHGRGRGRGNEKLQVEEVTIKPRRQRNERNNSSKMSRRIITRYFYMPITQAAKA